LVEAPDGTLAATAIIWLDEVTRTAEFEPVGTHREFRRQRLGTALQLHGMHLAKAAGATRMLVACLGAQAHPAARNMYYGVGFREFTRDVPQIKTANA
jgi:GNAT superfamily N-acetyltransferase